MTWTQHQQDQLLTLIRQRNERDVLQKQLTRTQAELDEQLIQQQMLYDELLKEETDVDRLERFSWAKLYYDLLNRREEQLTKERVEAEAALSRYELIKEQTADLQKQLETLTHKLTPFVGVDATYDALIDQKTGFLLIQSGPTQDQYKGHVEALTVADKQLREVKEAHKAGLMALDQVLQLLELIDDAHSWGNWDIMSRSAVVSAAKYQRLNDVREQSRIVNGYLRQFQSELADVQQDMKLDGPIADDLTRFVDIFFDNFLTDWSVQRRIERLHHETRLLEQRVVFALRLLRQQVEAAVVEAQTRHDKLRRFLENS